MDRRPDSAAESPTGRGKKKSGPNTRIRTVRLALAVSCSGAFALPPAPIADPVERDLLPSGISHLPLRINGSLAYAFQDHDGTDVLHCVGDCLLRLGDHGGQALQSREAVVWILERDIAGQTYRHVQTLLWRDAEVQEAGGTITSGPALFVSLSTTGSIHADVDELAYQSSAETRAYQEGNAVRLAVNAGVVPGSDADVALRVFDASGLSSEPERRTTRPMVHVRSGGDMVLSTIEHGRQVLTITGGVYLSRGTPGWDDFVEIEADSVVVFLPAEAALPEGFGRGAPRTPDEGARGLGPEVQPDETQDDATREEKEPRSIRTRQRLSTGLGDVVVESTYLDGDVVLRQGPNVIRATRLFYDFSRDRALILDAVMRTTIAERNIPLIARASEIRQLSRDRFVASDAILTTSEFHTPHYHVGAEKVELVDRSPRELAGGRRGLRAGTFTIRHATLNLGGRPLLYWPYIRGNLDTSETSIRGLRTGFSDDFGVELETKWHLFNVLGFETPNGFDSTLKLDYFTRRGPATGVDVDYERDKYAGTIRSYLLVDSDKDFLGRQRVSPSEKDVRGRFLMRHRQYLEDEWQLSLELSYISDESFLEEFFESEFDNDKAQETLLYLKKQQENWAVTALLQTRPLDFTTQTERFPDLAFFLSGEPIADRASGYSENRLGMVRYRPGTQTFRELLRDGRLDGSGTVARADSRQEITLPVDVGPVRLVPFASIRGTIWDDSPEDGGIGRVFGSYGVRGSMYLSRVYPTMRSAMFDIDGVRHIIKPDLTAWISHTNQPSDALFPFDETVEQIDEIDGIAVGVRQRWQTRRGGGTTRRTVDFLTFDVEAGIFNDAEHDEVTNGFASFSRPENSISRNYVNSSVIWRLNDRTALLSEVNYDVNDGEVDVLNVSVAVERSPRLSYLLGYRLIEESDSELLGFDMNYRLTEKHSLALRELFDLDRGRILDFTVALVRKFPHWFGAVSFAFDDAEDDFGVSLSIWPEGLPQATLGSRRFTSFPSGSPLPRS